MYVTALKTATDSQKMSSVHVAILWLSYIRVTLSHYIKDRHMCGVTKWLSDGRSKLPAILDWRLWLIPGLGGGELLQNWGRGHCLEVDSS